MVISENLIICLYFIDKADFYQSVFGQPWKREEIKIVDVEKREKRHQINPVNSLIERISEIKINKNHSRDYEKQENFVQIRF